MIFSFFLGTGINEKSPYKALLQSYISIFLGYYCIKRPKARKKKDSQPGVRPLPVSHKISPWKDI